MISSVLIPSWVTSVRPGVRPPRVSQATVSTTSPTATSRRDVFALTRFGNDATVSDANRTVLEAEGPDKKLLDLEVLTKKVKQDFPADPIPGEFIMAHRGNKPLQEGYGIIKRAITSFKASEAVPDTFASHLRSEIGNFYKANQGKPADIRSIREAMLGSGAIRWEELKSLITDPSLDFRNEALKQMGLPKADASVKTSALPKNGKRQTVLSDLDLTASSPEHYKALIGQLASHGYSVNRVLDADKSKVLFHHVPELDLTVWPADHAKAVHHGLANIVKSNSFAGIPSLQAIGHLAQERQLAKEQLHQMSPAQFNQNIRDMAKAWYKFAVGASRLPNLPGDLPRIDVEQANVMRRVVDYDLSAMEAIDIRLKQRVGPETWYENRNTIINGILNTQEKLHSLITPYLSHFRKQTPENQG